MDDLSFLEQLMGGAADEAGGASGGVWVVSPEGALDDGILRLVGKARLVADSLGTYVHLLLAWDERRGDVQPGIAAGADVIWRASGAPNLDDLVEFLQPKTPQVVLFPRTRTGRVLGPGLAQVLGGSLCGYAADVAVDPVYQRVQAHQPVMDDAARRVVVLLNSPAVAVVDTAMLPAAFSEPWRAGQIEDTGLIWAAPSAYPKADYQPQPPTVRNARIIVGAGRGLRDAAGFDLARRLAEALGGVVGGDLGALDAGWIDEEHLLGLTGHSAAPKLYLALGIEGDTEHLAGLAEAAIVVAVQPDRTAPITRFANWNVLADPATFAATLLRMLAT
jgi:electron transfer flavoprotein alpha subunit